MQINTHSITDIHPLNLLYCAYFSYNISFIAFSLLFLPSCCIHISLLFLPSCCMHISTIIFFIVLYAYFRSFFVRFSSFFSHNMFTDSRYYRDIKKQQLIFLIDFFHTFLSFKKPASKQRLAFVIVFILLFFYSITF